MKGIHSMSLIILMVSTAILSKAQETRLYNERADATQEIAMAVTIAHKNNQHVLIQGGGNWCSWCIKFNKFTREDAQIDSMIRADYQVVHLNYSKENKNEAIFAQYGFPQRFGFPVFIILDGAGNRIHTQNSEYLEDGKSGYDRKRVIEFLKAWSPAAIDPKTYQSKK
ncbi:MAG: thioredoxin family protein [Saprospiraceae bacterium]|nr:thioredoxin family protein [Candidatus Parvibacillus calidus]